MKNYFLLLFGACFVSLNAQSGHISGKVLNGTDQKPLQNAVILVLNHKDSMLVGFTRSNPAGQFLLNGLDSGKFILKCSYPGSVDYVDTFRLTQGQSRSFDTISIIDKVSALKEIIINKYVNGIRINGDTTEYLADYFKTNPGATVEDLLKKLPGIQVNKNGEITAQGEKVKKILVDGEEFFPEDPTIATKYLRADMIDKVQVYDQREDTTNKSDQDKVKTLNLTLKADKKKGYFGKAEVGSNFDAYTNGGIFSGYFNKSLKSAGYFKTSNFENASLGWNEGNQYGGIAGGGYQYNEEYGYYYSGMDNFNDELDSRGIPFNTSAGAVLNNHWDSGKVKVKLNSSYRYANEGVNGTIIGNSRYFLPDTSYSIQDTTLNRSNQDGHRGSLNLSFKLDSFNTVMLVATGAYNVGKASNTLQSGTAASRQINHSNRYLENSYNRMSLNTELTWNRTYRKKGRSLHNQLSFNYKPGQRDQLLQTENNFFNEAGKVVKTQLIDQLRQSNNNNKTFGVNSYFNDRINKYFTYNIGYNLNLQSDRNRVNSYNRENGKLSDAIDSLSNNYDFTQFRNTASFTLRYSRKKWSYWATASGGTTHYEQNNLSLDTTLSRNFINFFPRAGFTYSWRKQSNVQMYYSGSTQAPSLTAIQPLVNNTNPFDLNVGNPNLVQSFSHNISLYLHSYRTIKGRFLRGNVSANIPRNAFVNSTTVDTNAVRRTMTVNANGNYYLNGEISYTVRMKKMPLFFSWDGEATNSKNVAYTNGQEMITNRSSMTGGMNLSFSADKVDIQFGYKLSWNTSKNNLQSKATQYLIKTPNYHIEVELPKQFSIYHSGDFNIRPASAVFSSNRNVYYLNAGMSKAFGKKQNLEFSFYVNDILNQNQGFDRNISTNLVTEQVYTQLARYWMVQLRWNFSSTGGKVGDDD